MAATVPRRRLAAADRRELIIEGATSLIAQSGYNAFTLSDLAQHCGITRAGITHHFASKEDIFVAVLGHRDRLDLSEQGLSEADLPHSREGFRLALGRLVERNFNQPEIVRLYTVLNAESLDPEHPAHEYFAQRLADAREALSIVAKGWHPDPDRLAVEILSFMDGLQLNWLRDPALEFRAIWHAFSERILAPAE